MIALFLLAAAEPAKTPSLEEQRFADCVALSERDPKAAVQSAESWRLSGGGLDARLCLGLAYAAQQRWQAARLAFELAAQEAERSHDKRAALFWVQSANAALAGGELVIARGAIDAALAMATLEGADLGEAHLDRARANAGLNALSAARGDLDQALMLVPQDPLAWLLSATLARREGNRERAAKDISEAARLSPDDPSVALEAGNIAVLMGAPAAAKLAWEMAVKNGPDTEAGRSAAKALEQFEVTPPAASAPEKGDPAPAAAPR